MTVNTCFAFVFFTLFKAFTDEFPVKNRIIARKIILCTFIFMILFDVFLEFKENIIDSSFTVNININWVIHLTLLQAAMPI